MVKPFAFYGRVSTEDQQDPASSRAWQLRRALELIEPGGGAVVAEFFDVGQSRSLPWKRRPEASRLLELLRSPDRGFEAVAIGEPQRAFYGAQFALTFPLFEHYGVELWVPEVGGPVDPGSEAHDMVMTLFGGMSKGERSRIRTRVRSAMAAQAATEGRFLGGRPPYGYRLTDAGPHPISGKAALGIRIHRLEPDPITASVVVRIFEEYVSGRGLYGIAEGLTRGGVPSPSANDRARNPHRSGEGWSKSAVRAILTNPRYTGVAVWGRQRRDEVLVDVEDVAAGHRTRMRWNDEDAWVRSPDVVHEPLIRPELFEAARAQRAANARGTVRKPRRTSRSYLLRGLLRCGLCERRMQGSWNHEQAYYRCCYPAEYALPRRAQHPKAVYVREARIVPPLDDWIAGVFEPNRLEGTCRALAEAQEPPAGDDDRMTAARQALADCDARLARYREALETGVDATVVGQWIREVQAERRRAEEELRHRRPASTLSEEEIRALVANLGILVGVLEAAEPQKKADLYESLGLSLTYEPTKQRVLVEADLGGVHMVRVGGPSGTSHTPLVVERKVPHGGRGGAVGPCAGPQGCPSPAAREAGRRAGPAASLPRYRPSPLGTESRRRPAALPSPCRVWRTVGEYLPPPIREDPSVAIEVALVALVLRRIQGHPSRVAPEIPIRPRGLVHEVDGAVNLEFRLPPLFPHGSLAPSPTCWSSGRTGSRAGGHRTGGTFGGHLFPDEMDRLAEHLDAAHGAASVQIAASVRHEGHAEVIQFPSDGRTRPSEPGGFLVARGGLEPPTDGS